MSNALYQSVTDTILEALERGVVPWKRPWHTTAQPPTSLATGKPYRGVNSFLLGLAPFTDHRWLTFRQAQERGGRIVKGSKASTAVFWKLWEPGNGEEPETPKRIPVLRYYKVWNVEQTEGLDVPSVYLPEPSAEHQRVSRAELLVQGMPGPPAISEGGDRAWYSPSQDRVQVPKLQAFSSADHYYGTLFHELGHSTGHEKRLNRKEVAGTARFGSGSYSKEELVAELTAAFCCAAARLDNTLIEDSASYIDGWLRVLKTDAKAVVIAAAQAQKAADYIKGVTYA